MHCTDHSVIYDTNSISTWLYICMLLTVQSRLMWAIGVSADVCTVIRHKKDIQKNKGQLKCEAITQVKCNIERSKQVSKCNNKLAQLWAFSNLYWPMFMSHKSSITIMIIGQHIQSTSTNPFRKHGQP